MTVSIAKRQAIAAALRPWLGDEETAVALEMVEEDAAFNLLRFADRVYDRLAPRCARRDFHRALVQSVFLGAPEEASGSEGSGGDAAGTRVFARLLGEFLRLLAAQRGPAETTVRAYLFEKVGRFGFPPAGRHAVAEWLGGHSREPAVPLARDGMRQMVNLSYVLACEYLGPVNADRLLSAAVKEAESMPEARVFPPRGLL